MDDLEENAAIVNALQRGADVVVQKSLAEGFGLTVAEAMWKAPRRSSRAGSAASRTRSSTATAACCSTTRATSTRTARAVRGLLDDPERAAAMGAAAHERVRERFLGTHSLLDYLALFERLM